MSQAPARASAEWLALREPADAAARASELVAAVRAALPATGRVTVHDLGCGTGSTARWLAPQLPGPQHWVLHDRDAALLAVAAESAPAGDADGTPVTTEIRRGDVTRLGPEELSGADLVTASALLDMLTLEELRRLVVTCAEPGCPVLVTLSVTGHVELAPADPLDRVVATAFNAHQRRATAAGRLLGPDAFEAAVAGFTRLGLDVLTAPSPWRLGPEQAALTGQWFTGWLAAACEQEPELAATTRSYRAGRLAEVAAEALSVTVHHRDLLVRP